MITYAMLLFISPMYQNNFLTLLESYFVRLLFHTTRHWRFTIFRHSQVPSVIISQLARFANLAPLFGIKSLIQTSVELSCVSSANVKLVQYSETNNK